MWPCLKNTSERKTIACPAWLTTFEKDQETLLAKFHKVEAEEMGEGTHERYLQIANALADRYGIAKPSTDRARVGTIEPQHTSEPTQTI